MLKKTGNLASFLTTRTFVVTHTIEEIQKGTRVKVTNITPDGKVVFTIKSLPEGSIFDDDAAKRTIKVGEESLNLYRKYGTGSTHTVSASTFFTKVSEPEEFADIVFDLTPVSGTPSRDLGNYKALLKLDEKTKTIIVQGKISSYTSMLDGVIVLSNTKMNGIPYAIGFVNYESFKKYAVPMKENVISNENLYNTLKDFSINLQMARGEEGRAVAINCSKGLNVPNFEGVKFYQLEVAFEAFKPRFANRIREAIASINRNRQIYPESFLGVNG